MYVIPVEHTDNDIGPIRTATRFARNVAYFVVLLFYFTVRLGDEELRIGWQLSVV
jgi:hypothetical protein